MECYNSCTQQQLIKALCCRHFGREIAAYDIQTKRCDVYGQGDGFTDRAMLIYDGLHYDALAVSGDTLTLPLCTHQG